MRDRSYTAPYTSVMEITRGVTTYRLANRRWPTTQAELEEGFRRWGAVPEFLSEIKSITLVEETKATAKYRFEFKGGGTSEFRINLK